MMIKWEAFVAVAVSTLVGALIVVTVVSIAVRMHAAAIGAPGGARRWLRFGEYACYVLCAAAVLFGIYLVVPILHGG